MGALSLSSKGTKGSSKSFATQRLEKETIVPSVKIQDSGPGLIGGGDWCSEQQRCLSFTRVHGCCLHQGLEQLQRQAGLWHWSASSPPPSPPQPGASGLNVQGTAVILAWSFQFYKPDLSPRLTLMLSPSLVHGADDDVRDKCLKIELGSFEAMAELRARICCRSLRGWEMVRGKTNEVCARFSSIYSCKL